MILFSEKMQRSSIEKINVIRNLLDIIYRIVTSLIQKRYDDFIANENKSLDVAQFLDLHVNRVIGNLFTPIIFSSITGSTRAQMYRFVRDNELEDDIVSFATDSICTSRDLGLKSNKLGEFSLDKTGEDAYYLQNGIYRFNGKWKERGLGSLKGKTIEHVDTVEKDGQLYLKLQVTRNSRLRSSILQGRIHDIGKIKPVTRLIDLNADRKRFWLGTLKSVDDELCNDSMPISLIHFS
jgi:hypothetical protein